MVSLNYPDGADWLKFITMYSQEAGYIFIFVVVSAYRDEEFTCSDGYRKCPTSDKCIPESWFCDGDNACGDYSDEEADCRKHAYIVSKLES